MTGVAEIARKLPYRYPMLLVDRVVDVVPGERLTALKAVTASEPWFRDCPPGDPHPTAVPSPVVFPPVLLIESLCQATGLLAAWDAPRPSVLSGEVMLLGALSDVTLHGSVEPGCVIEHQVRLLRGFDDAFLFEGVSTVDDRRVLRVGQILMAIRPAATVTARAAETAATSAAEPVSAGSTAGLAQEGVR